MLLGLALYNLMMGIEMFLSTSIGFEAYIIILVSQLTVLFICVARGQTSFGFCSLTFVFKGMMLAIGVDSTEAVTTITFFTGILILQLI